MYDLQVNISSIATPLNHYFLIAAKSADMKMIQWLKTVRPVFQKSYAYI